MLQLNRSVMASMDSGGFVLGFAVWTFEAFVKFV